MTFLYAMHVPLTIVFLAFAGAMIFFSRKDPR